MPSPNVMALTSVASLPRQQRVCRVFRTSHIKGVRHEASCVAALKREAGAAVGPGWHAAHGKRALALHRMLVAVPPAMQAHVEELVVHYAALEAEVAQQEGVVARSRAAHAEVAEALQARRAALTRCDEAMAAASAERQARFAAWLLMLSAFGPLTFAATEAVWKAEEWGK